MIQDPSDELVRLVTRSGDEPRAADRRAAALVRRRFGLALPPPFAAPVTAGPDGSPDLAIRPAIAVDGPAIAAVKWRSWRVGYRGVVPDDLLDHLEVVPPVPYWTALAGSGATSGEQVVVAGRPGEVHGFCVVGALGAGAVGSQDDDLDPNATGRVRSLYVDPSLFRRGVGARLLGEALTRLVAMGSSDARLWVIDLNTAARAFYEACGWQLDGATVRHRFAGLTTDEVRYRYVGPPG